MLAVQILIDGFAISALYALGAVGFTLMFGVSGVLNLAHGATMVVAAVTAWVVAGQYAANPWLAAIAGTTSITVLLGEQNVTFALPHADRIYVPDHARIVWEGEPSRFAGEAAATYL